MQTYYEVKERETEKLREKRKRFEVGRKDQKELKMYEQVHFETERIWN